MSSLSTFKEPLWKSFHDVSQSKGIYYQWVKPSSLGSKNPLFFQDLHNVDTSSSQVRMFLVEHPTTSPTIGFEWRWQVLWFVKSVKHKCLGSHELDPNHETNLLLDLELWKAIIEHKFKFFKRASWKVNWSDEF